MPLPRSRIVSLSDTPYYHCISRCVRRAYLCGKDKLTGKSYEHRREWVEEALLKLGQIFAIDICAYAVMSNHTHVVLHVDKDRVKQWSLEEIFTRWHKLYKGTLLSQRYMNKTARAEISDYEMLAVSQTAEVYRARLYDISWFMRVLNEGIARQANKEDNCTGRFWEGRYKSQALLDEAALAACMAYVDLNPVRAKIAKTPETSCYTSVKRRCAALKAKQNQPDLLMPFLAESGSEAQQHQTLPFHLPDYLWLVDVTGKFHRKGKRGAISIHQSPILNRLGLSGNQWLNESRRLSKKSTLILNRTG